MNTVDVDGLEIAYRDTGGGPELVLLHGGMCDSRDWRPQIESLGDDFRLIAWDAPGCGESDDPPDSWDMSSWAHALKGFLNQIGIKHAHILGLSWGSGLAIEFYRLYPETPKSLILAGAYAGWKGSLAPEEVERRLLHNLQELDNPSDSFIPDFVSTLVTDHTPDTVVAEVTQHHSEYHPVGAKVMLTAFANYDGRPTLPKIQVPTLLIYGELDVRSPLEVARSLQDQIPAAELVVIPDAGHLVNFDAQEQFDRAVRTFIESY